MEPERSRTRPGAEDPRAPEEEEEEQLRSRVAEIIGGVYHGARRSLADSVRQEEEVEEEGDDSVFYDEGERAPRPVEEEVRGPGVRDPRKCKRERQGEGEAVGASGLEERDAVALETQMEQETARRPPVERRGGPQPGAATEDLERPGGGPELRPPIRKGEEEVVVGSPCPQRKEAHAPEQEPGSATEEEKCAGVENLHQQMSTDEPQAPGAEPGQLEQQDRNSQGSAGRPRQPKPGYSTLPLGASGTKQAALEREATPRYNTLSYRKIQRGNTRQKIKDFEFMVMKL